MKYLTPDYWGNHMLVAMATASAMIIVISMIADKRRHNRKNIEDVGFMPWPFITVMAVLATVLLTALAIKSG